MVKVYCIAQVPADCHVHSVLYQLELLSGTLSLIVPPYLRREAADLLNQRIEELQLTASMKGKGHSS